MKKAIKLLALVSAVIMCVTCFAGCNKKEDGEKVYVIATDTMFAPFEFTDANNQFVGIDVDLLVSSAVTAALKPRERNSYLNP